MHKLTERIGCRRIRLTHILQQHIIKQAAKDVFRGRQVADGVVSWEHDGPVREGSPQKDLQQFDRTVGGISVPSPIF